MTLPVWTATLEPRRHNTVIVLKENNWRSSTTHPAKLSCKKKSEKGHILIRQTKTKQIYYKHAH